MKYIAPFVILFCIFTQRTARAQTITTITGTGAAAFSGDGGAAISATINVAWGVAVDTAGNIIIGDGGNNRIRKISSTGVISTIAGTGPATFGGDGGAATSAQLNFPSGVAFDQLGNIYISDANNHRVRKINTAGIISTLAGTGVAGFSGDGGPATAAKIVFSDGICADNFGNVFIPDPSNHRIRKVNSAGIISTFAGTGTGGYTGDGAAATSAQIDYPSDIDADAAGNVYFTDFQRHVVRKISTTGIITTVAGSGLAGYSGDGGTATAAKLNYPVGIDIDNCGNLYIGDRSNNRIRVVNSAGTIATIAGTGVAGFSGDGGAATAAKISNPHAVCHDTKGYIYIVDRNNYRVRKVKLVNRAPEFTGGISQSITICGSATVAINTQLAANDSDVNQLLNWSVLTGPVNGTLGGFIATGTSTGTTITPTGLSYTPATGYSGSDSFSIIIADCLAADTITIYVTIGSSSGLGAITGPATVCVGAAISLTNATSGGTWYATNTHASVSGGIVTGLSAGIDTIGYGIASSCGFDTVIKIITVYPLPAIPTTGIGICIGTSTTLTTSGAATYTWAPAATLSSSTGSSVVATPAVNTVYTITGTSTFGCVSTATASVFVNPVPAPPVVVSPVTYCRYATAAPLSATGSSLLWYTTATGGTGSSVMPVVNTSAPGTYTYWVSQSSGTCESSRASITVTIINNATAAFSSSIHLGCLADTVYYSNLSTGATGYQWFFGDGTSSATVSPVHVYTSHAVYTVTLVAYSGACSDSGMQTIDLRHTDSAAFTLASTSLCSSVPVVFTNHSTANTPVYTWLFGDGATSTATDPTHTYTATGTYTVTLIVADLIPCLDTAYTVVHVDSTTPLSMWVSDSTICLGAAITMTASYTASTGSWLTWNMGNGDTAGYFNPITYTYPLPGTYVLSATAHYSACPAQTVTHTIQVMPTPSIDLGPDSSVCSGVGEIIISNVAHNAPGAIWLWNTGASTESITVTTEGIYSATVRFGNCIASDSVLINNNCSIGVPNVFTPNGDNLNEYFDPRDYLGKNLVSFHMSIYNRWGECIFETNKTTGTGWDGKYNDIPQPIGVFVYMFTARLQNGDRVSMHGNVTLLR